MLVMLALGALCAALALLTAHLHLARVADALAVGAALCGLMGFASAAGFTVRRARQLRTRSDRP